MATNLILHKGATRVDRTELAAAPCPPPTETWFPVPHLSVLESVVAKLGDAGFRVVREQLGMFRDGSRFFGTLDLDRPLFGGSSLSVGVRNSVDKSFPMGFIAGSRVFVCDNLAFSSELLVARKHTRFGEERFQEAILNAVGRLDSFRQIEAQRIEALQTHDLGLNTADAIMVEAFYSGLIPARQLTAIIAQWRSPEYDWGKAGTAWHLYNAFTTPLQKTSQSNPTKFQRATMGLMALIGREVPGFDQFIEPKMIEALRDTDEDEVGTEANPIEV